MKLTQNEITGAYYEDDSHPLISFFFATLAVLFTLAFLTTLIFIIAGWIVGAENVTNTLADLVVNIRN